MKSKVFKTAWQFFKAQLFSSFSDCLRMAWKRVKLIKSLSSGLAYFSFKKVNGEIRNAVGTLHSDNFDYQPKTNGQSRKSNLSVIKYWDVEKRAFRSFKITNFLTFN